ncbi:hypothetical protein Y032_0188g1138 [Ancylostoma ceylanicum]|uniref:Uncharacterized protein n=1 Tax=Ancylostoma ceylanicum TaxID=53326 RepID=A0A016SR92_9BILA|nr:hypothetical protein Y032_0188g1138 [Ancylostoma ceylanicum]
MWQACIGNDSKNPNRNSLEKLCQDKFIHQLRNLILHYGSLYFSCDSIILIVQFDYFLCFTYLTIQMTATTSEYCLATGAVAFLNRRVACPLQHIHIIPTSCSNRNDNHARLHLLSELI